MGKYRPDLLHLPTTNGEHCTGDGIKMGERVGAKTIDLEWVQVHPTGLVKPDDADAKVKFLAAEALRGVGGVLIDREGKRFANELGRRDYVTGRMWKNKPPFRLCLNKKAATEIHWHCEHYKGRGVMKFYQSARDLAKEMGIQESVLEQTFKDHTSIGEKQASNPDGGQYDAYPNGKSHDVWGKKFFHNLPTVIDDEYHVAIVTPSIHYCMGGLEITTKGEVMGPGDSRSRASTLRVRSRAACTATTAWAAAPCSTASRTAAWRAATAPRGCSALTGSTASSRPTTWTRTCRVESTRFEALEGDG